MPRRGFVTPALVSTPRAAPRGAGALRQRPLARRAPGATPVAWAALALGAACLGGAVGRAQTPSAPPPVEESAKPLIERAPFDRVTFDAANGNAVLDVLPLPFPDRRPPRPLPKTGNLRMRLVQEPDVLREAPWSALVNVELYEEMLSRETERLIAAGKMTEAYEHLEFLFKNYPNLPDLKDARLYYLYSDGGLLFKQGRYHEALAVIEELYRLEPKYQRGASRPLKAVLGDILDRVLEGYVTGERFASARKFIERVAKDYGAEQDAAAEKWREALRTLAGAARDDARAHLAAGRSRQAHAAVRRLYAIWPDLAEAKELAAEVERRFPLVVAAVTQVAGRPDPTSLDNWAARRVGRLTERALFEFAGFTPEGGQYTCALGSVEPSEDLKQLIFQLRPPGARNDSPHADGHELAQWLLEQANPESPAYSAAFSQIVASVAVEEVYRVRLTLRRPHVLPQALLQSRWPPRTAPAAAAFGAPAFGEAPAPREPAFGAVADDGAGLYALAKSSANEAQYLVRERYKSPARRLEIVEVAAPSTGAALDAMRRGEVDLVDRLLPAEAARLKDSPDVVVVRYDAPTVHWLAPNWRRPYSANRTFRRALVYGLNRERIVRADLLEGGALPGCQVLSGPFPAGLSPTDPVAYAYDDALTPQAYEPRLALTLVQVAQSELTAAAVARGQPQPRLPILMLAHPAAEIPRRACQAIQRQWAAIGVTCALRELPPGETSDPAGDHDFLYVEATITEPLVDAPRLLAPRGDEPLSPYLLMALRRAQSAPTWPAARQALRDAHRLALQEAAVLPLWQLSEHYARRAELLGAPERPFTLYEKLEDWRFGESR